MSERYDIVVVGAGPAGIAAATRAAATGLRVCLVDDNPAPGGQIWRRGGIHSSAANRWLDMLEAVPVVCLQGCRVFDRPEPGLLRAEFSDGCRTLRYGRLILATGARERFLPFPGWTLPNIMGAGGLDAMVRGGLPIAGKSVVVAGTGPLLLAVAAHLARRGAKIVALCEQTSLRRLISFTFQLFGEPAKLVQGIEYGMATRHARFYSSCWPVAAEGIESLESVTLQQDGRQWQQRCDYLACGYHLVPNLELPTLLHCRIEDGFVATNGLMETSIADVYCVGELTGIGGVELAVLEGQIAGLAAAGKTKDAEKLALCRNRKLGFVRALKSVTALDPQLKTVAKDTTIVCRCEDVAFGTLRTNRSWREAKLHSRCGMGPCQGRICGAAADFLFGWDSASIQSNTRPPIFPVRVSSLAPEPTLTSSQRETL